MARILLLSFVLLLLPASRALADDDATEPAGAPAAAAEPVVGVITGDHVNVRVGPRIDNREVTHLNEGDVVLIVEERGDWLCVRLPSGFPVAVSTDYTEAVGPDALRVKTNRLNLRVHPPQSGLPAPGIFQDHPEVGTLLPLLEMVEMPEPAEEGAPVGGVRSGGWAWVLAPEEIRAFVHGRYVKRLGPVAEHADLVEAARAKRQQAVERLAEARQEEARRTSGLRLMETLGAVQQDLYRLRIAGGTDKTPIVALANRMDAALDAEGAAADGVLRLARALREDLEREIQLRVARYQAEVARTRGLDAPALEPLEPVVEDASVTGDIRYEPTPGWKEEGVYFLWIDGRPRFALRLTIGGPLPHPDFASHAEAGPRRLVGRQPGTRLFGLPVFEVRAVERAPE